MLPTFRSCASRGVALPGCLVAEASALREEDLTPDLLKSATRQADVWSGDDPKLPARRLDHEENRGARSRTPWSRCSTPSYDMVRPTCTCGRGRPRSCGSRVRWCR